MDFSTRSYYKCYNDVAAKKSEINTMLMIPYMKWKLDNHQLVKNVKHDFKYLKMMEILSGEEIIILCVRLKRE